MATLMHAWRRLVIAALLLASWLPPAHAEHDIYLVVQVSNPVKALTQKEAMDLYTGRARTFPTGELVLLFDLPRESRDRAEFYQRLTGMSIAQINSFWARLMFSGQIMPPQTLPNEQAMLDIVRRNPSALGYLTSEPTDKGLRTVLTLRSPAP